MYAEASEAPVHPGCRSAHRPGRKPSSLLNRLLKFPMALRLLSLRRRGRSVCPKSTVSRLRVQYGYASMAFLAPFAPAVHAKDRASGLCSSQGSLAPFLPLSLARERGNLGKLNIPGPGHYAGPWPYAILSWYL